MSERKSPLKEPEEVKKKLIHDMKNNINIIYGYVQLEISNTEHLNTCTKKINELIEQIESIKTLKL